MFNTEHNGQPVLAVAHAASGITRLVLGAAEDEPNVQFQRYTELQDVVPRVGELLIPQACTLME